MPEYLSPGVYVEEVSFRAKAIEGVATSTTGFAGMTRTGPIQYKDGPSSSEPRLITSFTQFERVYGSIDPLEVETSPGATDQRVGYLAHAARAFFINGGQRLWVTRVSTTRADGTFGVASRTISFAGTTATWRARWPGQLGNVFVDAVAERSGNLAFDHASFGVQVRRARAGAVIEIRSAGAL